MKNKKVGLIVLIMMLAIGFAAVSTSLIVNGTGVFITNEEDFKVIFVESIIDGVDVSDTTISEDGRTLTFTTRELTIKGDNSLLEFVVKNNSTQYDAEISMECKSTKENESNYYKIDNTIPEVINAGKRVPGTVKVTLTKTSVDEIEETFTCTINATATERTEVGQTGIVVSATDSNDNNLNAKAYEITGDEEEKLLNSLVETGYIEDITDVDALIEVESDSFDSIAYTTFDVSSIADPEDTVVILHYDEKNALWEYIGTETVDESGIVTGDFTSYSPVAFVVVKDGAYESHLTHTDTNNDGLCDICGKQGKIMYVYHNHTSACKKVCTIYYAYGEVYGANLQNTWVTHSDVGKCGGSNSAKTHVPYSGKVGNFEEYHEYLICGKSTSTIESQYTVFE